MAAARAMTEHLIALGRRRIAAIGRESQEGTASVRLLGLPAGAGGGGRGVRPRPGDRRGALRAGGRLDGDAARCWSCDDPPDAVFCFNDLMAIGALRACVDAGVEVPDEVAVAGFDDITEGRFSNPHADHRFR